MSRELNTVEASAVAVETAPLEPPPAPEPVDPVAAAITVLEAAGYIVRKRTTVERTLVAKADPLEVAAFFEASGLSRKELADACGVTVSVIATVQNPNGDRWSATLFEARKRLITAYAEAKAALAAKAEEKAE